MFGGTKENPRPLGEKKGFFVQEDNVALEFNIPPARSLNEWIQGLNYSLAKIQEETDAYGMDIAIDAAVIFDPDELTDPRAMTFGCDADYNAWTMEMNPHPSAKNKNLRTGAGHVHFGCTSVDPWLFVRAMDLYLGIPSVLMDQNGSTRRELYGKAGAYRPKPYGGEYRVLSNFWLKSENLQQWVYTQTQRAANYVRSGNYIEDKSSLGKAIQICINTSDKELAMGLTAEHNLVVI